MAPRIVACVVGRARVGEMFNQAVNTPHAADPIGRISEIAGGVGRVKVRLILLEAGVPNVLRQGFFTVREDPGQYFRFANSHQSPEERLIRMQIHKSSVLLSMRIPDPLAFTLL